MPELTPFCVGSEVYPLTGFGSYGYQTWYVILNAVYIQGYLEPVWLFS